MRLLHQRRNKCGLINASTVTTAFRHRYLPRHDEWYPYTIIQLNPQYEAIFNPRNIDEDCNKIADEINDVVRLQIKEILVVGMYKQAVTLYLQLLKSMCKHFVEDEHFCYFDDMYSPEYTMQWIYESIRKHDLDTEPQAMLVEGHKEILQSECYEDYVYLYI